MLDKPTLAPVSQRPSFELFAFYQSYGWIRQDSPGTRDATAGRFLDQWAKILCAVKPDLDFRVTANAGHWVMYEAPELFVAQLRALLR